MPVISRAQRQRLLEETGGICPVCQRPPDWRGLQICHIRNKGMGGSKERDTIENVRVKCARCHFRDDHGINEVESQPMWGAGGE